MVDFVLYRAAMEQHRITCEEEDRYVGKCRIHDSAVSHLAEWYSESIMVRLMLLSASIFRYSTRLRLPFV